MSTEKEKLVNKEKLIYWALNLVLLLIIVFLLYNHSSLSSQPRYLILGDLSTRYTNWDPAFPVEPDSGSVEIVNDLRLGMKEVKDKYIFKVDLPGMDKDSIFIQINGNYLTIAGNRELTYDEAVDPELGFYRTERFFGDFERTITIPRDIDANKIKASYSKGVLTIKVPKAIGLEPIKRGITVK